MILESYKEESGGRDWVDLRPLGALSCRRVCVCVCLAGASLTHVSLAGIGRQGWCDCSVVLFGLTPGPHTFTAADRCISFSKGGGNKCLLATDRGDQAKQTKATVAL